MPQLVVNGALLQCTTGTAPSTLIVLPKNRVNGSKVPAANIMDYVPMMNIMPFGTCNVLTAAALGVPTPCVPAVVAPWAPGSPTVMVGKLPALTNTSKAVCTIGGAISINMAGQFTVNAK
jgi:1-acyl-sn-glycerol-3-phosphate acyltransferase